MELWVRSQNKETLAKVDNLNIDKDDYSIYTQAQTYQIVFGTYKSKERALQILDEIQNILNPKLFVNVRPSEETTELLGSLQHGKTLKMKNDFEYKEISTCVYEMPEE